MSGEHAFLPPSGAGVWVLCAMWATMNARYPETVPEPDSLLGQAVHWIIHHELTTGVQLLAGHGTPQGIIVDDEMTEGAEEFYKAIEPIRHQELHLEERVTGTVVHPTHNWGTPDLWTFAFPVLDVFDYKHGHEHVEVYENWQLINYAALILAKLGITGAHDQQITVRLHVVQPRSYTPEGAHRTWTLKASDLRGHVNILRGAAERATGLEPTASVNPGCKHCPGRHACVMLQRVALTAADQSGHSLPVELPPEAVGLELRMLKRAERALAARITGLEQQAESLLRNGQSVPWWALESVQGREAWGKAPAEVIAMAQALGIDVSKPGIITPKQARDKGLMPAIVDAYTAPRGTAIKLVEADTLKARKVFG